jgi:ubiquinone/menaquinone biosynthesis C-methylase UbiE
MIATERDLYKRLWTTDYKRSQCAVPMASKVIKEVRKEDNLLEIGSGDCTTASILLKEGYKIKPSDIYATCPMVVECPAWALPFVDKEFDVSFSTDVLEHLPTDKVVDSIKEILRVTKRKSIHVIATWGSTSKDGEILHKTVREIDWWQDIFKQNNPNNVDLLIISRDAFL